jgi:hypothetical protein
MGIFGGDDSGNSAGNSAIDEQIARNDRELEQKRQSLYTQRIDIIKAQGGQNWTPEKPSTLPRPLYGKQADVLGAFSDRFVSAALGQGHTGTIGKNTSIN